MIESEGWYLPLEFSGVFKEYRSHRDFVVVWDASNLGAIRVAGPGAFGLVQRTFSNGLHRCEAGRSQYTFLLRESDAGILDDLMVWRVERDLFYLTPSRPRIVLDALLAARDAEPHPDCVVEDVSAGRVLLAVQGGEARSFMARFDPAAASLPAFGVRELKVGGETALVAATRFGRQPGFELQLDASAARGLYHRLLAGGAVPAGVGMRETHRLEAGVARYGFELRPDVTALEAGLGHAVDFETEFVGRSALARQRRDGVRRLLRAVVMSGRLSPSAGDELFRDGRAIGRVTSGNFSPRLHRGLAFAYVDAQVEPGQRVTVHTAQSQAEGRLAAVPVDLGASW